ncbi:hypothetical protein GIR35_12295 [Enterococcus faecalis]|nr:hypothetical protein GIR35_12295 [Enterococcus faecalis]
MQHHFDIEIAEVYGLNESIILNNIRFWVLHNEANGTNYYDGRFWTYNSQKAFEKLFPYMKPFAVRTALKSLEDNGLILTGNYNKSSYDRTKWYTLSDKANLLFTQVSPICGKPQMESEEYLSSTRGKPRLDSLNSSNRIEENRKPIPDRKPDRKPEPERIYGKYENVKLTDTDLSKLKEEFPGDWQERIDRLSTYMDRTGKSYKNHRETISNWANRDSERQKPVHILGSRTCEQNRQGKQIDDMSIEEIMERYSVNYMTAMELAFDMR